MYVVGLVALPVYQASVGVTFYGVDVDPAGRLACVDAGDVEVQAHVATDGQQGARLGEHE